MEKDAYFYKSSENSYEEDEIVSSLKIFLKEAFYKEPRAYDRGFLASP